MLAMESKLMDGPEKIVARKEITPLETSIQSFYKDVYIPSLYKYKYHIALVSILSKNEIRCIQIEQ